MDPNKVIPIADKFLGLSPDQLSWLFAIIIALSGLAFVIYLIKRDKRNGGDVHLENGNGKTPSTADLRALRKTLEDLRIQVAGAIADIESTKRRLEGIAKNVHKIAQTVHEDHATVAEHGRDITEIFARVNNNAERISNLEGWKGGHK